MSSPFEDTRKANPCEYVGQMIGTHQRSIEGDACMEKILLSVCISTDVSGGLPNYISANEGLHSSEGFDLNRQSIVNVSNLLPPSSSVDVCDDERQLHSTGTFITTIIEIAIKG
jgi:hypothetical protein